MMDIHTENLTILFVDIAGFTATTNRQSRAENAALLHTFDSTLLPHIKRFKGRVVKSIGDALLLTFRSPTDSMLCAMALQDAMHESNLHVPDAEKIHIRIAASLGEVRVTPKDIFGEPVNVASRIEGIAPADEIYLSEAVFMAMNKAEVPAQEVGFKELAGLPQAIRVYSIPRFATHRLIPQNAVPDQGGELLFPYGGMHVRIPNGASANKQSILSGISKKVVVGVAAIATVVIGLVWVMQGGQAPSTTPPRISNSAPASESPVVKDNVNPIAKKRTQLFDESWTVNTAKDALRSGRISKEEYKSIVRKIEADYRRKIGHLKMQYKNKLISKPEYERSVRVAKLEYRGR